MQSMADFIEIDFLAVETSKSGDAISLRYSIDGKEAIHVIDGGFLDTGDKMVEHLNLHYGTNHVNHVVLTHTDQDHVNGLRKVISNCQVDYLWMNRPWLYAEELISSFKTWNSVDALRRHLRNLYSAAATLEEEALEKKIPIRCALQGTRIGEFTVVAPSKQRYLDLIVASGKTPEAIDESKSDSFGRLLSSATRAVVNLVRAAWAQEYFPQQGTSSENEMSIIQFASIHEKQILLTGDAGREGLQEAIDHLGALGILEPKLWMFQVPHHGGRRNVNTDIFDKWLGQRLTAPPDKFLFNAICSSAKADEHHPRKSVIRAIQHRGGHFSATEGRNLCLSFGKSREGWTSVPQWQYPEDQEED